MFSIIIPNYNGKKLLEDCLKSVFRSIGYREKGIGYRGIAKKQQISKSLNVYKASDSERSISLEVIVVDNGSTDGSVEWLKAKGSKLKAVFNDKNLGFAEAVNQGIKKAQYPYLVVMNNDLKLKKDWLLEISKSIKTWEKKGKVGAYFGQVLDWEGKKIESTGLVYFPSGKALNRDNGKIFKKDRYDQEEVIWGASASVVVYSKKALDKVGLFDPLFFAYLEDVGLSLRLNSFGFKTVFVPSALSYHQGGATTKMFKGLRYRLVARNWWFIILKHYSSSYLLKNGPMFLVEQFNNFVKVGRLSGMGWVVKELILKCPKIIKKRKPILFPKKEG